MEVLLSSNLGPNARKSFYSGWLAGSEKGMELGKMTSAHVFAISKMTSAHVFAVGKMTSAHVSAQLLLALQLCYFSSMLQFAVGFVITPSCRGGRSKPKMGCRPSQKQNNAKKQVPSL